MELKLTSLDVLEECVKRGAQRLDTFHPGWWDRVEIDMIEACCPEHSVTGQLFGPDIETQMVAVGINPDDQVKPWACVSDFADMGFAVRRADLITIPDELRGMLAEFAARLTAASGVDMVRRMNPDVPIPVPRNPDVVTQDAFVLDMLWGRAVSERRS